MLLVIVVALVLSVAVGSAIIVVLVLSVAVGSGNFSTDLLTVAVLVVVEIPTFN